MIVCQGELSVAFVAADPKVLVVAYLVEASINVGLMRVDEAARFGVAVLHMMQKAHFSNEEVATQGTVVDQGSSFLSSENNF